jgi:integrase
VIEPIDLPLGVTIKTDVEFRPKCTNRPYRARARWTHPDTKKRDGISRSFETPEEAEQWLDQLKTLAEKGISPRSATLTLKEYGTANMPLALRGLELGTTDPYMCGWRKRIVPTLGHLPVTMITYGMVDRAVVGWIGKGASKHVIKSTLACLVRVMEQAMRDELRKDNPARIKGWQQLYKQVQDEIANPRKLALPDWAHLDELANGLVARSADKYRGWGDVVRFAACTGTRIGEVSGVRIGDIDTEAWVWSLVRQTTPSPGELNLDGTRQPGGLVDKGTKGDRARFVPIIEELRPMLSTRIAAAGGDANARLFRGPRGGRISSPVLRKATHWDDVVSELGYEWLVRHSLRHTGLTWMADAGVPLHVIQKIAGHTDPRTTELYLHPSRREIQNAGMLLSEHLWSHSGPTKEEDAA